MPFCAQCGAETQGSVCPACGTPAAAPPPAPTAPPTASAALEDRIVHALCYLLMPLTGVLFLVLEPYKTNRETRFHAFQSIFVFVTLFVGFQALAILAFTPVVGLLFSLVTLLYPLAWFATWLFLTWKAYQRERVVVPILGPLAESQK